MLVWDKSKQSDTENKEKEEANLSLTNPKLCLMKAR